MKINSVTALFIWVCLLSGITAAQSTATQPNSMPGMAMDHDPSMNTDHTKMGHMDMHDHGAGVPLSYAELTKTASLLEIARRATDKYHDVHVAEADGYQAIGPDMPGMGLHYVGSRGRSGFSIEQPSILLYEKDPSAPGGLALVGVSYLLAAVEGPDEQPVDAPFPKVLAKWHRHANICVLPDRSAKSTLSQDQCTAQGGSFTAETQWMVHAWIWKDSPTGVFAPTNPTVR